MTNLGEAGETAYRKIGVALMKALNEYVEAGGEEFQTVLEVSVFAFLCGCSPDAETAVRELELTAYNLLKLSKSTGMLMRLIEAENAESAPV